MKEHSIGPVIPIDSRVLQPYGVGPVTYKYQYDRGELQAEARLGMLFGAEETAETLAAPLADSLLSYVHQNVDRGLIDLTTPSGRRFSAIQQFGNAARNRLLNMDTDMWSLKQVIRGPQGLRVSGSVYDRHDVMTAARDFLLDGPTRRIVELAATVDPDIDELRLARLIRGRKLGRHLRLYDYDDIGLDSEALREQVIDAHFFRKTVKTPDGFYPVYLDAATVSSAALRAAPRVELGKQLAPSHAYGYAPRYLLHLHGIDQASHLAAPVVRWRQAAAKDGLQPQPQLAYGAGRTDYDRDTQTFVHYSPLLGAAVLAANVDGNNRGILNRLVGRARGNRTELPRRTAGYFPAIAATKHNEQGIIWSKSFRAIAKPLRDH